MVIRLTSHDDVTVEFTVAEVREIPYALDGFSEAELESDDTLELPTYLLNGAQLRQLKSVVRAKLAAPHGDYIPSFHTVDTGRFHIKTPPFMNLVWNTEPLDTYFISLEEEEITDLIIAAGMTCAWNIREGAVSILLMRLFRGEFTFEQFFTMPWLQVGCVPYIYNKRMNEALQEITSVHHNDYYAPHDNSHPD